METYFEQESLVTFKEYRFVLQLMQQAETAKEG
jgi:hypothetical protein